MLPELSSWLDVVSHADERTYTINGMLFKKMEKRKKKKRYPPIANKHKGFYLKTKPLKHSITDG